MYRLKADGTSLVRIETGHPITTGQQNAVYVQFEFSAAWSNYSKAAIFSDGHIEVTKLEGTWSSGNVCAIPPEVCKVPGRMISVWLTGHNGRDVISPPVKCELQTVKRGKRATNEISSDEELTVVEQLQRQVDLLQKELEAPTQNVPIVELEKIKTTKLSKAAILRIHFSGVEGYTADDGLSLKLWRAATIRGRAGRWGAARNWGYAQIAGREQELADDTGNVYGTITYDPVPDWMPNGGFVKTDFPLSNEDLTRGYIDIDLRQWLLPLLKPTIHPSTLEQLWSEAQLFGTRQAQTAHYIKFHLMKDGNIFGRCQNTVGFGLRRRSEKVIDMTSNEIIPREGIYYTFR